MNNEKPVSNVVKGQPSFEKINNKIINFGIGVINSETEKDKPALFNFAIKPSYDSNFTHKKSLDQDDDIFDLKSGYNEFCNKNKNIHENPIQNRHSIQNKANKSSLLDFKKIPSINNSENQEIDKNDDNYLQNKSKNESINKKNRVINDNFTFNDMPIHDNFTFNDMQDVNSNKTIEDKSNNRQKEEVIDLMTFETIQGLKKNENKLKKDFNSANDRNEKFDPLNVIESIKKEELKMKNQETIRMQNFNYVSEQNRNNNLNRTQSMYNINRNYEPVFQLPINYENQINNNPNFYVNNAYNYQNYYNK